MTQFQVKLTQVIEYEATVTATDAGEAARKLRVRALERTTAEDNISYVKRDFGVTDVHVHRIAEGAEQPKVTDVSLQTSLRVAAKLIRMDCENYTVGTCVDSTGRTPDAYYTADRWCDHCILREALVGKLPH